MIHKNPFINFVLHKEAVTRTSLDSTTKMHKQISLEMTNIGQNMSEKCAFNIFLCIWETWWPVQEAIRTFGLCPGGFRII